MKNKLFISGALCFGFLLFSNDDLAFANELENQNPAQLNNIEKEKVVENLGSVSEAVSESGDSLKSKEVYETEISKIKKELENLKDLKSIYKTDRVSLSRDIEELSLEIEQNENLINALLNSMKSKKLEIEETEEEILDLLKEIKEMEKEKIEREESFKGRVNSIYKNRDLNVIDVLIDSKSFGDMINRFFNYKTIVDSDNEAIEEYLKLIEKLDESKTDLEELKNKLEKQLTSLNSQKDKTEVKKSQLKELKVEKERQSMSTEEIINLINKDIRTLVNSIETLKVNKDKAEIFAELQSRVSKEVAEGIKNQSIYKYADLSNNEYISKSVQEEIDLGKMFVTPAEGRFTSGYGPRVVMGVYGVHMGIDLANKVGTDILASAEGIVLHAGPYSSYGNAIFVSHNIDGKDFVTVYGHLSVLGVKKGDIVEQGQIIGLMGNTGRSTGPHLHFEIQPNTSKFDYSKGVDPWKYLTENISDSILRDGYKSTDKIKDEKLK